MIVRLKDLRLITVGVAGVVLSAAACGTTTTEVAGEGGNTTDPLPIPPPGGSQEYPNEPDGFTRITQRSFNVLDEDGWEHTGGFNGSRFEIARDASAPESPDNVGVQIFRPGVDGGSPSNVHRDFSGRTSSQVYVSTWLKLSDNWHGHMTGVNKLFYLRVGAGNNVWRWLLSAQGADGGPLTLVPWSHDYSLEAAGRYLWANVGDAGDGTWNGWGPSSVMERGRWYHLEVLLVANTGGANNGQYHLWVNGVKIAEYTDIWFRNEGEPAFHGIEWNPVWGGWGDTLQEDQYMWMDDIYVSGSS